ncbi:MAG: hypothetical protein REI78_13720 [Pedobacter sp.]|nr:hypothetical protein [Pedobacter sp.]MDQ8054087.1 hypothetical protein [Pedobacter sp.]
MGTIKITLLYLLLLLSGTAFSQDLPVLKQIKLNKNSQYKAAEPSVGKVVDYLFATPINKKNKTRNEAGQFLLRWMNGTPDFTFFLEEKETDFFNTNSELMLMYMAALTKFALENPNIKDQKAMVLGAMSIVLPYLNSQDDKKTWSAELWQLNDAHQKGKLEKFLYQ